MRGCLAMMILLVLAACGDDETTSAVSTDLSASGGPMPSSASESMTGQVGSSPVMPNGPGTGTVAGQPPGQQAQTGGQMSSNSPTLDVTGSAAASMPETDCRDLASACDEGYACLQTVDGDWVCVSPGQSPDSMQAGEAGTPANAGGNSGMESDDDGGSQDRQCGSVEQPRPVQSGVAYVGAFTLPKLHWFRLDDALRADSAPTFGGELDLFAPIQDMALDEERELLFALHGVEKTLVVYTISRPTSPGEVISPPVERTRWTYTNTPTGLAVDRVRGRLYTFTLPPLADDGAPVTEMELTAHDLNASAGEFPQRESVTMPIVTSATIDAQRGLLFVFASRLNQLQVYDVTGQRPVHIPAMDIDLAATFPESNSTGFSLRNLRVDEDLGRLYAARAQGGNSQAVSFRYTSAKALAGACADIVPLTVQRDALDLSREASERTNLLDAFALEPVVGGDGLIFLAHAWNGTQSSAILAGLDGEMNYLPGCADFVADEDMTDFGCFLRKHVAGEPINAGFVVTDGALCVDSTHRAVLATSFDPNDNVGLGHIHLYRFDDELDLTRWLPADGRNFDFPGLPVMALCH